MDPVSAKQLRQELRAWLESNWDPNASLIQWRTKLTESGWGMPTWPTQWFGKDLPQALNPIVEEEFARINAVTVARTGIRLLAAATILEHGNDDQKSRYLPRILTGEDTWCQLFSEPGSGSDLAGAITRADFDGTHWIVNGQKVWTTLAHVSKWGMLVARTDPDQPKHKGMTYFLLDMESPGVEVRPLHQITGEAEFNEVFFDEATTDADLVVGEPGNGWAVAMGTLAFERGASTLGQQTGFRQELEDLVHLARLTGTLDDPVLRQDLSRAYAELEIMRFNQLRMLSALGNGRVPGPEMSIGKLYWATWHRRLGELGLRVRGASGMVGETATPPMEDPLGHGYRLDALQRTFLYSRCLLYTSPSPRDRG